MENGKNKEISTSKVIGIPRGLSYYLADFPWEEFFNNLGYRIVYSADSSVETLEAGNQFVGSDQCLPVKVYYGHTISLLKKTNNIFIPQYTSLKEGTYCCPKVIGLPQLISNTIDQDFNLITAEIDLGKEKSTRRNIRSLAMTLTMNPFRIREAVTCFDKYRNKSYQEIAAAKYNVSNGQFQAQNGLLGVVGHPYTLQDPLLNMGILKRLREFGFDHVTSGYEGTGTHPNSPGYFNRRKPHWDFGQDILNTVETMLQDKNIRGIIFITFFGCGIDAFLEEIFKDHVFNQKPYLGLTLDEHSGEAGLMTRIEAFLDMIIRKEGKKRNAG